MGVKSHRILEIRVRNFYKFKIQWGRQQHLHDEDEIRIVDNRDQLAFFKIPMLLVLRRNWTGQHGLGLQIWILVE